jgi:hypothetical protein
MFRKTEQQTWLISGQLSRAARAFLRGFTDGSVTRSRPHALVERRLHREAHFFLLKPEQEGWGDGLKGL